MTEVRTALLTEAKEQTQQTLLSAAVQERLGNQAVTLAGLIEQVQLPQQDRGRFTVEPGQLDDNSIRAYPILPSDWTMPNVLPYLASLEGMPFDDSMFSKLSDAIIGKSADGLWSEGIALNKYNQHAKTSHSLILFNKSFVDSPQPVQASLFAHELDHAYFHAQRAHDGASNPELDRARAVATERSAYNVSRHILEVSSLVHPDVTPDSVVAVVRQTTTPAKSAKIVRDYLRSFAKMQDGAYSKSATQNAIIAYGAGALTHQYGGEAQPTPDEIEAYRRLKLIH
ncbi:MAG TPA: hypothetical protein VLF43_00245 [Candidatus Saccharimonadales bacterium]|nr:hypothetical protein [Candidatus Saccharimonadales bacterium]